MNRFSWYEAASTEDAIKEVNSTVSKVIAGSSGAAAVFKSGGVDLLDLMKEGIAAPDKVVNIRNISGLDKIEYDSKEGLRLGANVTLGMIEDHTGIKENYLALHQSVAHAATPQLRNMASIGGNLAQRTRCWYFRSADHQCFRKGGSTCFARNGENEFHAIVKNGTCSSVHASSISTALLAFDAEVEVMGKDGKKRKIKLEEFFVLPGDDPTRENVLGDKDLITAVLLPAPPKNTKSAYIKQGARESYDWALADVAVVLENNRGTSKNARVVLGAAAPIPMRFKKAEAALEGKPINNATAATVAYAAMDGTTPLEKNEYKVPLFKTIIKRAILETA